MDFKEMLNATDVAWKPEPGDMLIGVVAAIRTVVGYEGKEYRAVTVTDEETGELLTWHAYHTVAAQEADNLRAGMRVGIKRLGVQTNKKGKNYEGWKVLVDGTTVPLEDLEPVAPLKDGSFF